MQTFGWIFQYLYTSAAARTPEKSHYQGDAEAVWHIDTLEGAFKELLQQKNLGLVAIDLNLFDMIRAQKVERLRAHGHVGKMDTQ